jgi:hypothetical protein
MEIELKHIAPYLPYGLKMMETHSKKIGQVSDIFTLGYDEDDIKICVDGSGDEHIWMFKPILHPLSDLINEDYDIRKDLLIYTPLNLDNDIEFIIETEDYSQEVDLFEGYEIMQKLFKNHFDVFRLIDKGLAIDINTLNK